MQFLLYRTLCLVELKEVGSECPARRLFEDAVFIKPLHYSYGLRKNLVYVLNHKVRLIKLLFGIGFPVTCSADIRHLVPLFLELLLCQTRYLARLDQIEPRGRFAVAVENAESL